MKKATIGVVLAGLTWLAAMPASAAASQGLKAAIGTDGLVLNSGDGSGRFYVLLVNEGDAPVEPRQLAPELLLDGRPVTGELARAFLRHDVGAPVAPGGHLQWGAVLDLFVQEPGLHRLMWRGRGFSSNEAAFLLLPSRLDLPKVDVRRLPADYSFFQNRLSSHSLSFDPGSRDGFQMDWRSCDLRSYDLERNAQLLYASFNTKTVFPAKLPKSFDPVKVMELGKDPGLGVRRLHQEGITGKGVSVAIIDQALLAGHREYDDRLRLYEEIHAEGQEASMHGPAVASLAVGKTVGVAPGADLFYIGMLVGDRVDGKFVHDLGYVAQGIDRLVAVNRLLPKDRRIRVISISLGMVESWKNYAQAKASIQAAEDSGIMVLTVENKAYPFDGLGRAPLADPERAESYSAGLMFCNNRQGSGDDVLQIPMDSRTLADPTGADAYSFSRVGGQSWIVPWVAGLYALACQARPDVTPALFWKAALETARRVEFERDGKSYALAKVVDPVALIRRLKKP